MSSAARSRNSRPARPQFPGQFEPLETRMLASANPASESVNSTAITPTAVVFPMPRKRTDLVTVGRNPYFILEPGHRTEYSGTEERKHYRSRSRC